VLYLTGTCPRVINLLLSLFFYLLIVTIVVIIVLVAEEGNDPTCVLELLVSKLGPGHETILTLAFHLK
jgi:hypothetical protein